MVIFPFFVDLIVDQDLKLTVPIGRGRGFPDPFVGTAVVQLDAVLPTQTRAGTANKEMI
jgi:hypothetical protein